MKKWVVELTSKAEKRFRADFKLGVIKQSDVKVIKRWISDIEEMGLEFAQLKADWRDHELDGEWKGYRAISFSYSGRVIYCIEQDKVMVLVVRVTTDHNYKK
jgi:addiction module RelE/StbE family toxin